MNRCKLYRASEQDRDKDIDEKPLESFDKILNEEIKPFHDELSMDFLKKTSGIIFTDNMHFQRKGKQYALHNLSVDIKVYLMVLRNSERGIYTDLEEMDKREFFFRGCTGETDIVYPDQYEANEKKQAIYQYLEEYKKEKLFAYNVESVEPGEFFYPHTMEIEKFYPLKIENYSLKAGTSLVVDSEGFFRRFKYDWRRDLPEIKEYIDTYYKYYRPLYDYKKYCTLFDLLETYMGEYTGEHLKDYKVVSHMFVAPIDDCQERYLPLVLVKYMKDGSVELYTKESCRCPFMNEIIDECLPKENVEFTFFLALDLLGNPYTPEDFQSVWFGGYVYGDYTELYNKDQSLIEFSRQIPMILQKMKIPIMDAE